MSRSVNKLDFNQFLVNAKISTYASGNDDFFVSPLLKESHQLEYSEGNLLYRDIYYGGLHFIGLETVFRDSQPFWGMSYYGGVLSETSDQQIAAMPSVLKAALREVPLAIPFRGPPTYHSDGYDYRNEVQGNISFFYGTETIRIQEQIIYRLDYSGGIVK